MTDQIAAIAGWIEDAQRICALTGAGISTESGIPDFRGPNGLWTKDPEAEKLSDIRWYMNDPGVRVKAWQHRLEHPVWKASPNRGHLALVALERAGKMHSIATQNVDGLHQAAGSSPEKVIELHGTIHEVVCMSCGERAPMRAALDRVEAGESDPACRTCGGILKSATVSFGQMLDDSDVERAMIDASESDVFLAIGTSLGVYPAAALPEVAVRAGAKLAIFNAEPTPYDPWADAVVREPLGHALGKLAARFDPATRSGGPSPGRILRR